MVGGLVYVGCRLLAAVHELSLLCCRLYAQHDTSVGFFLLIALIILLLKLITGDTDYMKQALQVNKNKTCLIKKRLAKINCDKNDKKHF